MSDPREIVAAAVRAHGAAHVARALGLSREAVLAYAGNFPTQAGTVAVIGDRIGRLSIATTRGDVATPGVRREC